MLTSQSWGGGIKKKIITFENIGHFADLREGGSVGPSVHYVHEVRTELAQVGVLIHVQLRLGRDFSDALGTFLSVGTIRFRLNKIPLLRDDTHAEERIRVTAAV